MKIFTLDNKKYFVISKISGIARNDFNEIGCWGLAVYMDNGDCYSQTYKEEENRDIVFNKLCKAIEEEQ